MIQITDTKLQLPRSNDSKYACIARIPRSINEEGQQLQLPTTTHKIYLHLIV